MTTGLVAIPRRRRIVRPVQPADQEQVIVAIFDTHYDRLCRVAALAGADDEAEDVVAEAFYELHRRWHQITDTGAAVGYLSGTIRNLVRMRIRHKQVVRRHEQHAQPDIERHRSAEQEVLLRADERRIGQALTRLPARQREAIVLRFWMDLKDREIAEAMGISLGAVKVHIFRALAGLKGELLLDRDHPAAALPAAA